MKYFTIFQFYYTHERVFWTVVIRVILAFR